MKEEDCDRACLCPCYYENQMSCLAGFEKVLDLKNAGLVIYRHTTQSGNKNENAKKPMRDSVDEENVFIFHNTKDADIQSADFLPEMEKRAITCPRCRQIMEHALKILQKVTAICKHEVIGICDHCKLKQQPCCECVGAIKKFFDFKNEANENVVIKKRVSEWLTKVQDEFNNYFADEKRPRTDTLKKYTADEKERIKARSDEHIDQLCRWKHVRGERDLNIRDIHHESDKGVLIKKPPAESDKLQKHIVFKLDDKQTVLDSSTSMFSIERRVKSAVSKVMRDEEDIKLLVSKIDKKEMLTKKDEKTIEDTKLGLTTPDYYHETRQKIYDKEKQLKTTDDVKEENKIIDSELTNQDVLDLPPEKDYFRLIVKKSESETLKKNFVFSFPRDIAEVDKSKQQKSSSELIHDVNNKIQEKNEEKKRIEEEKRRKKIEEEERKQAAKKEKEMRDEEKIRQEKIEAEMRLKQNDNRVYGKSQAKVPTYESSRKSISEVKDATRSRGIASESKLKSKESKESKPDVRSSKSEHKETKGGRKDKSKMFKTDENHDKMDAKQPRDEGKEPKSPAAKSEPKQSKAELKSEPKQPKGESKLKTETRKTESKEPKAESKPKSESKELKADLKQTKRESKQSKSEPKTDSKAVKSDYKEVKSDSKDTKDDIKKAAKPPLKDPKSTSKDPTDESKEPKIDLRDNDAKVEKKDRPPKTDTKEEKDTVKHDKDKKRKDEIEVDTQKDQKELEKSEKEKGQIKETTCPFAKKEKEEESIIKYGKDIKVRSPDEPRVPRRQLDAPPPPPVKQKVKKELKVNKINMLQPSQNLLSLDLVKVKVDKMKERTLSQLMTQSEIFLHLEEHKNLPAHECHMCINSNLELEYESRQKQKAEMQEIIDGRNIKSVLNYDQEKGGETVKPSLFKVKYDDQFKPEIIQAAKYTPVMVRKFTDETAKAEKKPASDEESKGVIRYALSDRSFIEKGWTKLPTEKVVRKMNVYRMRPAHPEFDWFKRNKNKRLMTYDTGERLAEFDDDGRGRWYYRNQRLALQYYDAEELNAQQRFVIFSNGEPDERGRPRPYSILATFDYLGNGVVFDHGGKIRLKYNQTEGVVLDRSIGPASHWKWHTLNDPPVLQQVMIDTQMTHKDPEILKMGGPQDNTLRPDNDDMLAIEFDNFIKEKGKKLKQTFKPFQIRMKAMKINEHFSLKILDQANVYLIYRDGTTNLKLNLGMLLDHKEIVDTDTAEVGEVSNNLERFPARTDSLAAMQKSVAYARHFERSRTERERRLRPPEPSASADKLRAGASRPLQPPLRAAHSSTTCATAPPCEPCLMSRSRKPSSNNVYYDSRLF